MRWSPEDGLSRSTSRPAGRPSSRRRAAAATRSRSRRWPRPATSRSAPPSADLGWRVTESPASTSPGSPSPPSTSTTTSRSTTPSRSGRSTRTSTTESVKAPMAALCAALAPEFGDGQGVPARTATCASPRTRRRTRPTRAPSSPSARPPAGTSRSRRAGSAPAPASTRHAGPRLAAIRDGDRRRPARHRARAALAALRRRLGRRRRPAQDHPARLRRRPPADRAAAPQVDDGRALLRLRAGRSTPPSCSTWSATTGARCARSSSGWRGTPSSRSASPRPMSPCASPARRPPFNPPPRNGGALADPGLSAAARRPRRPCAGDRLRQRRASASRCDGDLLEDVAQRAARRDPHVLEDLGGLVVGDRLGPQPVDARPADRRRPGSRRRRDHVGGLPARRQPPDCPRWLTTMPARRMSARIAWRKPCGISCSRAELLGAHRRAVVAAGDLDEGPEGVVGLGGDAHARSLSDRSDLPT